MEVYLSEMVNKAEMVLKLLIIEKRTNYTQLTPLLRHPRSLLLNQIKSTPPLEPLDLVLTHGMPCTDINDTTVLLGDLDGDILPGADVADADGLNEISARDKVIIGLVGERERQDALLLKVGLVDARKRARDDHWAT
ncbi:hypothetical protein BC938DRAFT_482810 [Jimgerdemannia flammicorona]|uniref:Uncharacterized protein n=1 Tax=Jimgerdemannia flammicorona TaxID=994334 RepID=A0A433QD57_9FUNG|nr:hypothetical protein BC938DRAFT_482810 [Jimgerdemannia flammicorona]